MYDIGIGTRLQKIVTFNYINTRAYDDTYLCKLVYVEILSFLYIVDIILCTF